MKLIVAFVTLALSLSGCGYCNSMNKEQFKGIVLDKHTDHVNRQTRITVVLAGTRHIPIFTNYDDTTAFYHDVHIGDSIIKQAGTTAFRIKTSTTNELHELNCN